MFPAVFASSALRGFYLFVRSCFVSFRCQFQCLRSSSSLWLFIVSAIRLFLPSVVCFSCCGSVFGFLFAICLLLLVASFLASCLRLCVSSSCGVVFGFLFEISFLFGLSLLLPFVRSCCLCCVVLLVASPLVFCLRSSFSSSCGVVFGFLFEIFFFFFLWRRLWLLV